MRTFISQTLNTPYPEGLIYLGIWALIFIIIGMILIKGFILFFTSGFYKIVLYLGVGFLFFLAFLFVFGIVTGI